MRSRCDREAAAGLLDYSDPLFVVRVRVVDVTDAKLGVRWCVADDSRAILDEL